MAFIRKHQQGGVVDPAAAQGGDPMEMLIQAAMQAVQAQDANMAMEVCMMLLEMVGGAPAPASQPVFKKGGKIARYTSPLDKFRK